MDGHNPDGSTTCEACLDWREAQSRSMGAHVVDLLTAVVADLGLDVEDDNVRTIMANRLREYGAVEGI